MAEPHSLTPPSLHAAAAQRWLARVQPQAPWLHEEVGRRMQERLDWVTVKPRHWVDWMPHTGGWAAHDQVAQRYAQAACTVIEPDPARRLAAQRRLQKPWWALSRWNAPPSDCLAQVQRPADMVWANMSLHLSPDPQAWLAQWLDALAVDGFLMFSCLGPNSLRELRHAYAARGWAPAHHEFTDMHDWGDMLLHAGFAEPVMDVEHITLTFSTPERLLAELRELGRNLHVARFAGLRGRSWLAQWHTLWADVQARQEPLTLTFEVVYGHAFKARPVARVKPQTTVALDDLRASLRSRRQEPAA
ncbi:MAG: methyltransferase domain-containing protein [Rhodoferax sp.]